MLACCCSLAETKACFACSKYINSNSVNWNVPAQRKVIEKYDDKGNLIERIIEEQPFTTAL